MLCMNRLDVLSHLEIDASRHEVRADEDPNLTSPEALNDIIALILKWCERRETPLRENETCPTSIYRASLHFHLFSTRP